MSKQPAETVNENPVSGEDGVRSAIAAAIHQLGAGDGVTIDLRPLPFEGTWGVATSVSHALAGERAQQELTASGQLADKSKKEIKKLTSDRARVLSQEIAESIVASLRQSDAFATVEAANGYVNITFDANVVASSLISTILSNGDAYGAGAARTERVMVEHSQPNTHKVFHIGHFRNTALGVSISKILAHAGYPVTEATYPGDIGMHVIKALWCYRSFHLGEEPANPDERGRWLGQIYAESDARLEYRNDVLDLLNTVSKDDPHIATAIDRLLKLLWREHADTEDIAYLMGRFTTPGEVKEDELIDDGTIEAFWPILGAYLQAEAEREPVHLEIEGANGHVEPSTTPQERYDSWLELDEHRDWWAQVPAWKEAIKATFQAWEAGDADLIAQWQTTREWSLADFRRIFDELGAHFDVWFFESEVEEEGKEIVKVLLDAGIAEISDGAAVVRIDEKLGLTDEVYRTLPILRSDGTSLYSTKDLALTRRKFEDYHIDRAIWVVDVRQSLYFKQIFKILELWGFEQAKASYHLPYEIVVLPDGVISSRKGRAPLYDDIRDQVLQRAREIIAEKNPSLSAADREQTAWQVGIGSLKYAMLARDNNKIVVFDIDEALSFDGHAAPYIQYAHARACRILENAKWNRDTVAGPEGFHLDFGAIEPSELSLLQELGRFPEEVQRAADQYRPLLIANYAFELARRFNDFYHACPVIQSEEPVRTARLALVDATRVTLRNALALLGIEAPEVM
ncbi:MAG: arginine--tRNA ligase [Thermomicrobiales bacterium]|nr:arginine--tRNA ligase [Thermomicrobiales bacterium]